MHKRFSIFILLLIENQCAEIKPKNNVCSTIEGYFHIDTSPDCYYDEDYTLKTPDFLRKYAGTFESYKMWTEDGYGVTMFRIPRKNPKGVVLLQHPMNTNSEIFTISGNRSLAIGLWNAGYDVWLNNHRGTNYSLDHMTLSAFQYEYWNFSFHELGAYDLREEVKTIRRVTNNSKIIFYGYSIGAAVGLTYSALFPEESEECFKVHIYAGTPCYFKYNSSPGMLAGMNVDAIQTVFSYLRIGPAVPLVQTMRRLAMFLLSKFPIYRYINRELYLIVFGRSGITYDATSLPVDVLSFMDYFSAKTIFHVLQLMISRDRFQFYNYGEKQNLVYYGTPLPPVYPVENITVPTYLISGDRDIVTTAKDADLLFERLSPKAKIYGKRLLPGVNHLDFAFGKYVSQNILDHLIEFLAKI